MGGIAGILSFTRGRADARRVERLLDLMHARGPDDRGLHRSASGKLVLGGCRRLPSQADAQSVWPLSNETDDIFAVIDGEVDNHRALRHSLTLDGHTFRGEAPAEVVVHAYEQYGHAFLDHLHGRFAVALWDERHHRLILARDRLGERPLYWARYDGGLAFASEAGPLLEATRLPRRLDMAALPQYLAYGFVMPPATLLEGIRKLGPGEALVMERGTRQQPLAWWTPARDQRRWAAVRALSSEHHENNLRVLLDSAVADRLTAHAALAALVDDDPQSLAMAAAMARLLGRSVTAYAMGEDAVCGAGAAAATAGVDLCPVAPPEGQMIACFGDYLRAMDEPLADPAAVRDWWLARALANAGLTVGLSTLGADAALLGPDLLRRHRRAPLAWRLLRRLPPWARGATLVAATPLLRLSGQAARAEALRQALDGEPPLGAPEALFADPSALLAPAFRGLVKQHPPTEAIARLRRAMPAWIAHDELGAMAWMELRTAVAEQRLAALDRMAVSHSVELRLPFLDDALVDYALAIPSEERAPGGRPRDLLTRALRGLLPMAPPSGRDAQPPTSAVAGWFRGDFARLLENTLERGRLFEGGPLDRNACLHLLRDHQMGRVSHHRQLWAVLVLSEWVERMDLEIPGALSTLSGAQAAVG